MWRGDLPNPLPPSLTGKGSQGEVERRRARGLTYPLPSQGRGRKARLSGKGKQGSVGRKWMANRIVRGQHVEEMKLQRAKELRKEMTPAEARLWAALRGNKLGGNHF